MVRCVVYEPVAGINQPFRSPGALAESVDVAFPPDSSLCLRQLVFPVSKAVTADAFPRQRIFQAPAAPSGLFRFLLGDEVFRQMPVGVQVQGNILFGGIATVFRDQRLLFLRSRVLCLDILFRFRNRRRRPGGIALRLRLKQQEIPVAAGRGRTRCCCDRRFAVVVPGGSKQNDERKNQDQDRSSGFSLR